MICKENRVYNFKDLSENQYGKLKVLNSYEIRTVGQKIKKKTAYWLCRCCCGKELYICGQHLTRKNQPIRGCGCSRRGGYNQLPVGEAAFNSLFHRYKYDANKKNRIFLLTKEQFKILTSSNCYYCNTVPSQNHHHGFYNGGYLYNGIDRIDSNIGYILDNCVSCCGDCNFAKQSLNQEQFLDLVKRIYNNRIKSNE